MSRLLELRRLAANVALAIQEEEAKKARAHPRRANGTVPCGTESAYYGHRYRLEKPCLDCKGAHAAAERRRARRRKLAREAS